MIRTTEGRVGFATAGTTVAAALLLAACGGGGSSGTSSPATSETPAMTGMPPMAGGAPMPMTMTVVEKNFAIELPQTSLTPGTHTFRVQNEGPSPHDLRIKGPGVTNAGSPVLNNGGTSEFTVTLQPGTYQLWCSVDGHRAQGMDTTITVG